MKVPFSYLADQFKNPDTLWPRMRTVIRRSDFTLGKEVAEFETVFAKIVGTKYAVGVNSGTDALFLSLKALGVGPGDEVITMPNTFIATAGAIAATGATIVFVDCDAEYLIDLTQIERAITPRTKAIVPVHYAGHPVDMPRLMKIAREHSLFVVEDTCQAIGAAIGSKSAGSFGDAGAFSFHPLKNINVWSDAGLIVTNSKVLRDKLRLLRNHGMKDRDTYTVFGYNSWLDTVQAAIGLGLIKDLEWVTETRIMYAMLYDKGLGGIPEIVVPPRRKNARYVHHLYIVEAERRDKLLSFLNKKGVEAKIHYPVPLHLQECSRALGYKEGDFPVAEGHAKRIITLPAHQYLSLKQVQFTIRTIREFYGSKAN